MKNKLLYLGVSSLFFLNACIEREPEGPGEQIGRGIDMIRKGVDNFDQDGNSLSRSEQERLRRNQEEHQREGDEQRNLERDPYYDTPSETGDQDWNSKRRY